MDQILRFGKAPMMGFLVSRVLITCCKTMIIIMKINFEARFGIGMILKGYAYLYGNIATIILLQMKPVIKGTWDLLYAKNIKRLMKLFCMF